MSLTPEDRALIEAQRKNGRVMSLDDDVFTCSIGGLAALLAAAREEGYRAAMQEGQAVELHLLEKLEAAREEARQPPEDVREKAIKALREHIKVDATGLRPAVIGHHIFGFEEAADAILALPAVAVGDGWRPIETAPKDGTPFLAFNPFAGVYHTAHTVRWTGDPEEYTAAMEGKPTYEGFPCGFMANGFAAFPFGQWDVVPTHWQPLPAPPHGGGG